MNLTDQELKTLTKKVIQDHFPNLPGWVMEQQFYEHVKLEIHCKIDESLAEGHGFIDIGKEISVMLSSVHFDPWIDADSECTSHCIYDIRKFRIIQNLPTIPTIST
jgi:hypothetical protein